MTAPLRVMVVDDSSLVRKAVIEALHGVPGLEVVSSAPNGRIALRKIAASPPDVCVLDLEMPEMDGAELLGHLRRDFPATRVVVLTAHGELAASRAVQALLTGATDVVRKPAGEGGFAASTLALRERLVPRILQFASRAAATSARAPAAPPTGPWRPRVLVVGVSTGGPEALLRLLPALPATFPLPTLVVQHMPPGFTRALAERLDARSALRVAEAAGGEPLRPGQVWLAPGGRHLAVHAGEGGLETALRDDPPLNSCRPAVDVLFHSAAAACGPDVLALVMTGMGADGADGARALKALGARVWAQDEASSVVWGMPGAVVAAGAADAVLGLDALAAELGALAVPVAPGCPA